MGKGLIKWIQRLKKGDQSAFLPLYENTSPGLFRFLLWKTNGNKELSEDILQESYVRFLVNLDKIESTEEISVQSYLLQIVKNCLIDKVSRTSQVNKNNVSIDFIPAIVDHAQTAKQEQAVQMRELSIAMKSLNEKDSEIIWLRDALGFSHKEVAEQIGGTEEASRQAYVRAKKQLLEILKPSIEEGMGGIYAPT